jgi:ABC-type dipeptide/oligopeptide/nickel transport system permease component
VSAFLLRRAVGAVISAWAVVTIVFFLARLTGDPLAFMLPDTATPEQVQQVRAERGFDQPLPLQYARFLVLAAQGDFGMSIRHAEPALGSVLQYMPATIELAIASLVIAVVVGVSLGVLAALRPGSLFELLTMSTALAGQAIPSFWLGLMLIMLFGVQLRWLPSSGRGDIWHLILPAVTLGAVFMAAFARLTRSSVLEQLQQDYIRTARGKGLSEVRVVGHALRNAAIPLATQVGLTFGRALSGSVITETIFAWPGVGRFALQAVYNRDFPVVQATVFLVAIIFLAINFLMDVLYTWLDPRIRLA